MTSLILSRARQKTLTPTKKGGCGCFKLSGDIKARISCRTGWPTCLLSVISCMLLPPLTGPVISRNGRDGLCSPVAVSVSTLHTAQSLRAVKYGSFGTIGWRLHCTVRGTKTSRRQISSTPVNANNHASRQGVAHQNQLVSRPRSRIPMRSRPTVYFDLGLN
jgi:hypothetical protein